MKFETQYGRKSGWRELPASDDPVIQARWLAAFRASTHLSDQEILTRLDSGEVIELREIEWHDRVRKSHAA